MLFQKSEIKFAIESKLLSNLIIDMHVSSISLRDSIGFSTYKQLNLHNQRYLRILLWKLFLDQNAWCNYFDLEVAQIA